VHHAGGWQPSSCEAVHPAPVVPWALAAALQRRMPVPGHLGAESAWCPGEYSSGTSRVQGSITKAGNTHLRRLLIEAAWHHRKPYRNAGPTMRARWARCSLAVRARGHAGNRRLHQRRQRFTERGKNPLVANVAIARELAGWCWSLATLE